VRPEGGKAERAEPWAPHIEAGTNVKLLRANWNAAWLDEHRAFPSGAHDAARVARELGQDGKPTVAAAAEFAHHWGKCDAAGREAVRRVLGAAGVPVPGEA
jgi:hypothetical protein